MKSKSRGRPSTYKDEYVEQAYKLCLLGATDVEISEILGCAESTLNLWKKEHKEFSESLKKGKMIADSEVAYNLHRRASGFRYEEVTQELVDDELTITKIVKKEFAPDTGAAMAWLKNRSPNHWRDKREMEIDHTSNNDGILRLADLLNKPVKDRPASDFEEEE
jgi:hypothetical protein